MLQDADLQVHQWHWQLCDRCLLSCTCSRPVLLIEVAARRLGFSFSSSVFIKPQGELTHQLPCTKWRHFRGEHNVRGRSVAHYPSWSVSGDHSCWNHWGFSSCILLLQVKTSFHRLYLQSHTFTAAGCISQDKPIIFNVSADSLPSDEVYVFIVIILRKEKQSDFAKPSS